MSQRWTVLPFLAPRLFSPWPATARSYRAVQRSTRTISTVRDKNVTNNEAGGCLSSHTIPNIRAAAVTSSHIQPAEPASNAVDSGTDDGCILFKKRTRARRRFPRLQRDPGSRAVNKAWEVIGRSLQDSPRRVDEKARAKPTTHGSGEAIYSDPPSFNLPERPASNASRLRETNPLSLTMKDTSKALEFTYPDLATHGSLCRSHDGSLEHSKSGEWQSSNSIRSRSAPTKEQRKEGYGTREQKTISASRTMVSGLEQQRNLSSAEQLKKWSTGQPANRKAVSALSRLGSSESSMHTSLRHQKGGLHLKSPMSRLQRSQGRRSRQPSSQARTWRWKRLQLNSPAPSYKSRRLELLSLRKRWRWIRQHRPNALSPNQKAIIHSQLRPEEELRSALLRREVFHVDGLQQPVFLVYDGGLGKWQRDYIRTQLHTDDLQRVLRREVVRVKGLKRPIFIFQESNPAALTPGQRALIRKQLNTQALRSGMKSLPIFVRLRFKGNKLEAFHSHWVQNFRMLNARFDPLVKDPMVPSEEVTDYWSNLARSLIQAPSLSHARALWQKDSQKGFKSWRKLMFATIRSQPEWLGKLVEVTITTPGIPAFAVNDCLEFMINHSLADKPSNPRAAAAICDLIDKIIQNTDEDFLDIDQYPLRTLLRHTTPEDMERLYHNLLEAGYQFDTALLEVFMSRLAKSSRTRLALNIMNELNESKVKWDINRPRSLLATTFLLMREHRGSGDEALSDSEIFSRLLGFGLQPTPRIYNILLQNILQTDSLDAGWEVYEQMAENNLEPNAATYSTLLHHSQMQNSWPDVARVIELIQEKDIRNDFVVANILMSILRLAEAGKQTVTPAWDNSTSTPEVVFAQLLDVYSSYYHMDSLQKLVPFPLGIHQSDERRAKALTKPNDVILTIVLLALIRRTQDTQRITRLYQHVRSLLLQGHQTVTLLFKTTHFYDAIIKALGADLSTIHLCPQIVNDMIERHALTSSEPPATEKGEEVNQEPSSPTLAQTLEKLLQQQGESGFIKNIALEKRAEAAPSVQTFSILLHAYTRHGQMKPAEEVLKLMRKRNLTPNIVTWNTLIDGYVKLNDIPAVVASIQRMKQAGIRPDNVTAWVLRKVDDIEKLRQALIAQSDSPIGNIDGRLSGLGAQRIPTVWGHRQDVHHRFEA